MVLRHLTCKNSGEPEVEIRAGGGDMEVRGHYFALALCISREQEGKDARPGTALCCGHFLSPCLPGFTGGECHLGWASLDPSEF